MTMPRKTPAPDRPRKSPLRVAAGSPPFAAIGQPAAEMTGEQLRAMMISEFCQWLRSRTSKEKRPFQEETITAYKVAARALDAWMASAGLDGDFTACDTEVLNRFFRDYHAAHGQGGTNTKQRNLRHLFTWLEYEYDHPHPYTDDLNRYAPVKTRPSTLSMDFIKDPISSYLRMRRYHRHAAAPQLWLGLRNHGPMNGWGLYRMLQRRAAQTGYDPDVHPHMFRH